MRDYDRNTNVSGITLSGHTAGPESHRPANERYLPELLARRPHRDTARLFD